MSVSVSATQARNLPRANAESSTGGETLTPFMQGLAPDWHSQWAWDHYRSTILELSQRFGLKRLCEIGGGRDPLFAPAEAEAMGLTVTVNDIDAGELSHCPTGLSTARYDIAGDLSEPDVRRGGQDLMFSRMVFEHVHDVEQAWTNIHALLAPGGCALAFFPTLWNPVFAANHVLPERASRAIVHTLYPERHDGGGDPKFPALYDWCRSSKATLEPMLSRAGFGDIRIQPFWGHGYFRKIPVARELDNVFNRLAAKADWRAMTTYAYVMVRKAG